eukprot:2787205-Prymnesium_polylepis.1
MLSAGAGTARSEPARGKKAVAAQLQQAAIGCSARSVARAGMAEKRSATAASARALTWLAVCREGRTDDAVAHTHSVIVSDPPLGRGKRFVVQGGLRALRGFELETASSSSYARAWNTSPV